MLNSILNLMETNEYRVIKEEYSKLDSKELLNFTQLTIVLNKYLMDSEENYSEDKYSSEEEYVNSINNMAEDVIEIKDYLNLLIQKQELLIDTDVDDNKIEKLNSKILESSTILTKYKSKFQELEDLAREKVAKINENISDEKELDEKSIKDKQIEYSEDYVSKTDKNYYSSGQVSEFSNMFNVLIVIVITSIMIIAVTTFLPTLLTETVEKINTNIIELDNNLTKEE